MKMDKENFDGQVGQQPPLGEDEARQEKMNRGMDANCDAETGWSRDALAKGESEEPVFPLPHRRRRALYKVCDVAGIAFRDIDDIWDELEEGEELRLVRQRGNRYDRNAVAVVRDEDCCDDFHSPCFDRMIGYVPRKENKDIAMMMDMGWDDMFECELSEIDGDSPKTGSLTIKIYIVSKRPHDGNDQLRLMALDDAAYARLCDQLRVLGCVYYRWGGFPPDVYDLPERDDKVLFLHKRRGGSTDMYLMYCMAVGDDDAAYFIGDDESLYAVDDCCHYVFTCVKGPVTVDDSKLMFLDNEEIAVSQPEVFASEVASRRLCQLLFPEMGMDDKC